VKTVRVKKNIELKKWRSLFLGSKRWAAVPLVLVLLPAEDFQGVEEESGSTMSVETATVRATAMAAWSGSSTDEGIAHLTVHRAEIDDPVWR
jgi:hypothetical protein